MADLSSLAGLTFSPDDYSDFLGNFGVDLSQFAADGSVTINAEVPTLSNADDATASGGSPISAQVVSYSPSTTDPTPWGLGSVVINDVDASGTVVQTYTGDIIAINNGQVLLGIEPYDPGNPTDPYDQNYALLSDTSISLSGSTQPDGTDVSFTFSNTNPGAYQLPCFGAGTRIATPDGDVAVEAIAAGDLVLTLSGEARPVIWVGHRRVDVRRHARPETVRPVLIEAGAFGEAMPARDLVLSPDHSVYVDGALLPVKYLANGSNVRVLDVASVTYHHIELAAHDVVFAERMPAETFLDTGNRANFAGGAVVEAHPDFGTACDLVFHTWEARGFAPLVLAGPVLERARALLASRARNRRSATRAA